MSKVLTITLIVLAIFFVIGMIVGDYNCVKHLCNTITSAVYFVTDIVKTEAKGITFVFGGIAGFVG
jgi:nucleoside permease NupC